MKGPVSLVLVAAITVALTVFWLRREKHGLDFPPVPPPDLPRVEERMRNAVVTPAKVAPSRITAEEEPGSPAPAVQLSRGTLEWEARIALITEANELSESTKAARLLALAAALPENGMTDAAEQAVKRLRDTDYSAVALPVVVDPHTPGLIESVLFADLMQRPDAVTLPALLRIARTPNHPHARFAHDNLDLLLGENFGADWAKWEAAIRKTLTVKR